MFTVTQRVCVTHIVKNIFNIWSWFSRQTAEENPFLSQYYKQFAPFKCI